MRATTVRKRRPPIWRPDWARPSVRPDSALALTFPREEKRIQQAAIDDARLCGWVCFHAHRSDHSEGGFPDLVAVKTERSPWWGRPPFVLLAEFKGREGVLSPEQIAWGLVLRAVEAATGGIVVYRTWWPWNRPDVGAFFAGQDPIVAPVAPERSERDAQTE